MTDFADSLILGGGLSGLSLARFLEGDTLVLEGAESPGGLCRSYGRDGFRYDIGGHILFSRDQALLATMLGWLGENVRQERRNNQIWFRDRFVKYPFENGLHVLEKQDVYECLMGYLTRRDGDPVNLEEWCRMRFGDGIAERYLIPYNDKIWKRPARDISVHWVERVPSPPLEDVVKAAVGIETEGYTHQLHFYYPQRGGIEALITALAQGASVQTGFRVSQVRRDGAGWVVSDGQREVACRRLISTIPVFGLLAALGQVPEAVSQALGRLQYNSIIVAMVGVGHEGLKDKSAVYMPDPERLPHRVCYMSYFSPDNAPAGCSNLAAEITVPPGDPLLGTSDDAIVERVVEDVADLCGISAGEVIASDVRREEYAYVVYHNRYLEDRRTVLDYIASLGITPAGRFGSFDYLNMDQVIQQAQDLAAKLEISPTS